MKGAYWDYETVVAKAEGWPVPVFEEKAQTDANYERCARHWASTPAPVRPAFASHNLRSLAYGLAAARAAGLPDGAVELQMLYGMAEPVHAARRGRLGSAAAGLRPGRRARAGHGLPRAPPAGEHVQRVVPPPPFAEGKDLRQLVRPPKVKDKDLPDADPEAAVRPPTDPAAPGPFEHEPPAELRRITRPGPADGGGGRPRRARLGFEAPVVIGGKAVRTREEIVSRRPGRLRPGRVPERSGRKLPKSTPRWRRRWPPARSGAGSVSPDGRPCCSGRRRCSGPARPNWRR